jgi:hypothetical protein
VDRVKDRLPLGGGDVLSALFWLRFFASMEMKTPDTTKNEINTIINVSIAISLASKLRLRYIFDPRAR